MQKAASMARTLVLFLCASISSTYPCQSVRKSHFLSPFCQRLCALTNHQQWYCGGRHSGWHGNIFDNLLENFFPLKWWANQVQETVSHQLFLPLTNGRNHFFQIWNKTGTNFYEKNLSRLSPDCFRPRGNRNYIKGTQSIPIGGFKLVRFPTYFIFMFVGKPDWFKLGISEIGNWKKLKFPLKTKSACTSGNMGI